MLTMYGGLFLPKEAVDLLRSLNSDVPAVSLDSMRIV